MLPVPFALLAADRPRPPNALRILADDLRPGLGSYGGPAVTPHLGRLVAFTAEQVRHPRHGDLVEAIYLDDQIGKALTAIDGHKIHHNTLVFYLSVHNYCLGEHGLWAKASKFELNARVPLSIVPPGGRTRVSTGLAELVDPFPTVADLCGLPTPAGSDGVSLRPHLTDPSAGKPAAFTQHPRPPYPDRAPGGQRVVRPRRRPRRDAEPGRRPARPGRPGRRPQVASRPVPAEGSAVIALLAVLLAQPADLPVTKGIVFKSVGGKPLDLWLFPPARPAGPAAVVVYVHGGGWGKGDKANVLRRPMLDVVRHLTAGGVACASIEYRLTDGTATAADSVADCQDAVRFLKANAGKFDLDAGRVGLFGSSAGGHLALAAGMAADGDFPGDPALAGPPVRVRCVAAFFPLTTFVEPDVLAGSNFERPSRFVPILGGPLADNRELARKLSPVERVSAGGPPLFLAHGDADVVLSVRHSRRLAEAARKVGQPVELLEVKGGGHGFSGADVSPTPAEVARRTADFLLKHLQPQPKGSP